MTTLANLLEEWQELTSELKNLEVSQFSYMLFYVMQGFVLNRTPIKSI